MRLEKTWAVAKRELMARIRTKGFWISTVALPLLLGGLMAGPSLMAAKSHSELELAVVDTTGEGLGAELVRHLAGSHEGRGEGSVRFEVREIAPERNLADLAAQRTRLDSQVRAGELDGWLWLDTAALTRNSFPYHAENVSSPAVLGVLEEQVSEVVRDWRLEKAGYDSAKISDLTADLEADTLRITEEGSHKENGFLGLIVPLVLFFLLYMVFLIYGSQILQGVLEEKGSRIMEVLASTVRPTELMLGKIAGIGLAALIQMAIWLATVAAFTVPGLLGAMVMGGDGAAGLPALSLWVFVHFLLLFLAGFLMCASLYASIGAAFNNLEEAQQFAAIPMVIVIAPMFFIMPVLNDPNSTVAVVTSLIPFFTPMLMSLRISTQMPPVWQILLGYVLCGATVAFLVWLCARIYRVGILMYGKKPTVQEIWRWIRYA
jgi:ABC-2 type transport system permease protein